MRQIIGLKAQGLGVFGAELISAKKCSYMSVLELFWT